MTDDERQELAELRRKLSVLENTLGRLGAQLRAIEERAGQEPEASAEPPAHLARSAAPTQAESSPPRRSRFQPRFRIPAGPQRWLRGFLAEGNPLNKLGALSLIVGAGIVFKYAVDNGWIGPTGRVALGLVTGAALLAVGEVYARRGWHRFASGLVSGGNGLLFVSVWFGQQQYGVIPAGVAFALYVVVTAAVVAQSLRYDSLALAGWGLVGGYLAPALASTGEGNYALLSTYLLVLNGGVFAIAFRRDWRPLKWMAFLLTTIYTGTWVYEYAEHAGDTRFLELSWLLPYLAAFFVFFAAIPTWRSLRLREPIDVFGQVLTVANGVVHFVFAAVALHEEHRAWLGLVAVAVTLLYVAVSSKVVRQPSLDAKGLRVFAGTAAGFLLLATPYLATGPWITLVWCAQTVLLAWACTRPPFGFLQLHVFGMLAIILARLFEYDGLLSTQWAGGEARYIPLAELRSWPAFAAALTFGLTARLLGRMPAVRIPVGAVIGIGCLVLLVAMDGEAHRLARHTIAPLATGGLHSLIQAGLLVAVMCVLWFGAATRRIGGVLPWTAAFALAAALLFFASDALLWMGGYSAMRQILGDGFGLWWLHGGVLLMAPLLVLMAWLVREAPESGLGMPRERLQTLIFVVTLVVAMLLLRREAFAITHAPPFMDLFSEGARRAGYRTILSLSYALLAFGVYVSAVRTGMRPRLHAAYALYVFTAFKVYLFDLEAQNQLYRAFSLLVFAAILFVSSHFANREQRVQEERQHA